MTDVATICRYLEQLAPPQLAEEWDNVGLLVGAGDQSVKRLLTCLTITPASAAEAIDEEAELVVTHHPLPFQPVRRLTDDTTTGRLLLMLLRAGVAVYSPHTAFDSAREGINQKLAEGLQLEAIQPLLAPDPESPEAGMGRWGRLTEPVTLGQLAEQLKVFLAVDTLQLVGDPGRQVQYVGVACGSGGQLLPAARDCGCQVLVTGEASFHRCLEAEATGIALLLPGHFASERFAVEWLADRLAEQFDDVVVWASRREQDPLRWI